MLVPSLSRTLPIRDMASEILTKVFGTSTSEVLDKYQLGLTEIFVGADMMVFLENLRTARFNHCATVIQKNLKAIYYRRKYLEARRAILLIQFVTRKFLAWKHTQEIRKIKAAITIQRVWRGQKQHKSFNATCNNVVRMQAAAKGFLRRREIIDTRVRKAAVMIQRVWRSRRLMKGRRQYRRKVVIIQSLWRGKYARRRREEIRQAMASSHAVDQGDHDNDRIAELPPHWRTQVQRIKSIEAVEDCQRFYHKIRYPITSLDVRPDHDALERSGGPAKISARDRRLKQLKFLMEDGWEKEKSLETPRIVLQASRRVHLVELTASYVEENEAEKAAPKKPGRPSVKQRFVDVLFPHTIGHRRKNGRKGKKGRKVSDQKGQQVSEEDVRESAEKTFEYWIRLGRPLWTISQRYGLGILVVLPKEVTETSLHALRKDQDQDVVDYIDLCHPRLKEQISNLSSLLPDIIASGPSSKRLVIETLPHHELSDHSFEELFQFSDNRESPKLVDARRVETAVGLSDRGHANQQLSYVRDTIDSVHNMRPGGISPIADIKEGGPSNSVTDYSECARTSTSQGKFDYQELEQQPRKDVDPSVEPQLGHSSEDLNPQDFYIQDDEEWRVRQPSRGCDGEFPDSQDGDLQRSGSLEAEFFDFDLFINCSP